MAMNMNDIDHEAIIQNAAFTDLEGNEVTLADFRGKVLVIDFWETWCGPCLSAFPGFQRAVDEFPDDIVIIAATVGWNDGREDALRFKNEMNYDFYFVDGKDLADRLRFTSIPYKIILNREGQIIDVQTGSAGADREFEKLAEIIDSNE
jgi:thiol-disulfide isomerase/thioredoxin